jgi:hypothetical protein
VGNLVSDDGNFLNWKRFLLLPIVLLSSKNKKLIKKRIMMILQDQWEDFKVCQFIQRDYRSTISPSTNNNDGQSAFSYWINNEESVFHNSHNDENNRDMKKLQRVHKLITFGKLGKAMKVVLSDYNVSIHPSLEVVEKLRSKFPAKDNSSIDHHQMIDQISNFTLSSSDRLYRNKWI